jgi:hypothetical protein
VSVAVTKDQRRGRAVRRNRNVGLVITSLTTHVRFTDEHHARPARVSADQQRQGSWRSMAASSEVRPQSDSVRISELVHYAPVFAGISITGYRYPPRGSLDALRITGPITGRSLVAPMWMVLNTTASFPPSQSDPHAAGCRAAGTTPDWAARLTGDVQFDLKTTGRPRHHGHVYVHADAIELRRIQHRPSVDKGCVDAQGHECI